MKRLAEMQRVKIRQTDRRTNDSIQWRKEGAEVADRPGRHSGGGGKKAGKNWGVIKGHQASHDFWGR